MKKTLLLALGIFTLFACKKENPIIDAPNPESISECEMHGIKDLHPNHDQFQSILDKAVAQGFPGISALIYTPEEGLWQGTAGFAKVETKENMQTCNILYSGSVAKLYTVTAAMSLYEEGLLDLDAPIKNYLSQRLIDSLPNAQQATIRQLMNHTAGMPDVDEDEGYSNYILSNNGNLPNGEDQLAYIFDDLPNFKPGAGVQYSSSHTLTLALVLNNITTSHHSNLISEKIINPLNLKETYYKNEAGYPSPEKLVSGYLLETTAITNIDDFSINFVKGTEGDAGIIASAHDYYLFLKALMEGQIVSPSTLDLMLQPEWVFEMQGFGIGMGLGFLMLKKDEVIVKLGHSGTTVGGNAHLYYYPNTKSYLVLLTNSTIDVQSLNELWGGLSISNPDNPGPKSIIEEFEALFL